MGDNEVAKKCQVGVVHDQDHFSNTSLSVLSFDTATSAYNTFEKVAVD